MLIYNNWQSYDYAHRMPVKVRCYSQHCIIYFSQHCSVSPRVIINWWVLFGWTCSALRKQHIHLGPMRQEPAHMKAKQKQQVHWDGAIVWLLAWTKYAYFIMIPRPGFASTILIWKYISHPEYIFWSTLSGQAQLAFTTSGIPFTNFKRNL